MMDATTLVQAMRETSTFPKNFPYNVGGLYIESFDSEEAFDEDQPALSVRYLATGEIEEFNYDKEKWVKTTEESLKKVNSNEWFRVRHAAHIVICGMWHTILLQPTAAKEVLAELQNK